VRHPTASDSCCRLLLLLRPPTLCSWDRFGHNSGHRGHDDKVTGRHTTTTEHVAVPVDNVRIVDRV
jgi:hypothetical protein